MRLFILDQGLNSVGGHYFEYVRSIAKASTQCGIDCIVACHKRANYLTFSGGAVHPIYTYGVWDGVAGKNYHAARSLLEVSKSFTEETRRFLTEYSVGEGDVIFIPNIAKAHVMAAAWLAEEYGPKRANLFFMFRYPSHFFSGGVAKRAFHRLEAAVARYRIFLCTDSHRLGVELKEAFSLPFRILPIPHTDHLNLNPPSEGDVDPPLHIVSLGNARGEKGFREIIEAVALSGVKPWANRVRFTIQVSDPYDVEDAVAALRQSPDPRVTLIDQVLESEAYYRLLSEAEVVLTPYHRSVYRERTSGIFLEAMLAGKIVICTNDTWMSDVLAAHGGGIAIDDKSAAEICVAIEKIIGERESFSEKARAAARYWQPIHSPENFIAHLTVREKNKVVIPQARKALVVFPWGDALSRKSGGSVWLNLLVKFLEQHYGEVRVIFAAASENGGSIGTRSTAEPYHYFRMHTRCLWALLRGFSRILGASNEKGFHLWYHVWPRMDGRFRQRCEELVGWADDVYAEYSYFAPILAPYCRREGKTLHVTVHDVVSEQSKHVPIIYKATRALEFNALKHASRVYVVCDNDRVTLRKHGISAVLLPHPIDVDEGLPIFLPAERSAILEKLLQISETGRKICLFVGSSYGPNRIAAEFIRDLAARMHRDPCASDILFIVAGNCMESVRQQNLVALGIVEHAVLLALYERADIVLVPLTEGTGVSVKSIEALARGALIISTSVGMRGLSVEHERHCLIEDDLTAYPQRIIELLSNPGKAQAMRLEAAAFGACFDYRTIFVRYGMDDTSRVPKENIERIIAKRRKNAAEELLPQIRLLTDAGSRKYFYNAFQIDRLYDHRP